MFQKIREILFKNWLLQSVVLILITMVFTMMVTLSADTLYKNSYGKKNFPEKNISLQSPSQNTSTNQTETPGVGEQEQNNTNSQSQQTPSNTSNNQTTTNTSPGSNPGSTTTNPPAVQPPPPPPTTPSGCFVTVNGYLYNMQPAVNNSVTDPTTGKKKTHSSNNFQCGTFNSPTNMTSVYLSKHKQTLGCGNRLAPYIYTPPAPTDPTCQ